MPEPIFPRGRFIAAGATEAEVAQLDREFQTSDIAVQVSMANYYESRANADLLDYVVNLREADHFSEGASDESETPQGTDPLDPPVNASESPTEASEGTVAEVVSTDSSE